jgi:hypothetical protein
MPLFDRPPIDAISVSNSLFSSGTFRISGQSGVVSSDASGASINVAPNLVYFDNGLAAGSAPQVTQSIGPGTLSIFPLNPANEYFPGYMTVSTMMMGISHPALTATASSSAFTSSIQWGVYTLANSTQLSIINSGSSALTKGAATANTTLFSGGGARWITFTTGNWSSSPVFTPGQYWMAMNIRTVGLNVAGGLEGGSMASSGQRQGTFGASVVTNTGLGWYPMMGMWSVSSAGIPGSIAASGINQAAAGANFIPHVVFNNSWSSF